MAPKTAEILLYGYVWLINVGPAFFFSLFYILYYADAMGDTSDYHCVVDLANAGKMVSPHPLDYKAAGWTTSSIPEEIAKNPAKYVDVTEKWRGMMLFGMIVQILLFCLSIYQTVRFKPAPEVSNDNIAKGLTCLVGVANLTQIIMTLVARCGYAGKICGGDFLPEVPSKAD